MTTIHIPPAALEAGSTVLKHYHANAEDAARAAFEAMVKAWPGMRVSMLFPPNEPHVVLPITQTQEDGDGK